MCFVAYYRRFRRDSLPSIVFACLFAASSISGRIAFAEDSQSIIYSSLSKSINWNTELKTWDVEIQCRTIADHGQSGTTEDVINLTREIVRLSEGSAGSDETRIIVGACYGGWSFSTSNGDGADVARSYVFETRNGRTTRHPVTAIGKVASLNCNGLNCWPMYRKFDLRYVGVTHLLPIVDQGIQQVSENLAFLQKAEDKTVHINDTRINWVGKEKKVKILSVVQPAKYQDGTKLSIVHRLFFSAEDFDNGMILKYSILIADSSVTADYKESGNHLPDREVVTHWEQIANSSGKEHVVPASVVSRKWNEPRIHSAPPPSFVRTIQFKWHSVDEIEEKKYELDSMRATVKDLEKKVDQLLNR